MNNMTPKAAYLVGLDLGQAQDSTAMAVLGRQAARGPAAYAVRHLARWPPGTPYPLMAEEVGRLLGWPGLRGCRLVVGQTGVGRAVAALFRPRGAASVLPAVITSGHAVSRAEDGVTQVPKKELVSVLQVLLQTRRLKVAAELPLAETLSGEMAAFRAEVVAAGGDASVSWRERPHDDLVLAVALAAWDGERTPAASGVPLALGFRASQML